jgi:hypothetical protein
MSLHDFRTAVEISKGDKPFYGFIMAAMMKADTPNLVKLRMMYPDVWLELDTRYNAPGGYLEEEKAEAPENVRPRLNRRRGNWVSLDVVALFRLHGMAIIPKAPNPMIQPKEFLVECPWQKEHIGGHQDLEDTKVHLTQGKWPMFACSHASCQGRDLTELNALWGDLDRFCTERLPL